MSKTYLRSVWHLLSISVISVIFLAKRKISFEVSTFRGLLFSGGDRYFRRFAPFKGPLLSELYGTCPSKIKQNARAAFPKDKLEFKSFQALFRHGEWHVMG